MDRSISDMDQRIRRALEFCNIGPICGVVSATFSAIPGIESALLASPGRTILDELQRTESLIRSGLTKEVLVGVLPMRDGLADVAKSFEQNRIHLERALNALRAFAPSPDVSRVFDPSHLEMICNLSVSAQLIFQSLDWHNLGGRIRIEFDAQLRLARSATRLSERYAGLYASLSTPNGRLPSLPPEISVGPPVNVLAHARSLRVVTTRDPAEALIVEVRAEIVEATFDFVEENLGFLNRKYVTMLKGARKSAVDRGEDWVRHAASSYRQLMKNVLHQTAPTDLVRPWATGKGDLDDRGFPRRRTKVRWLCKDVEPESYRSFLVEDIDSALKLIGVLDEAVHENDFDICEQEFQWVSLRVERALQELLKLGARLR